MYVYTHVHTHAWTYVYALDAHISMTRQAVYTSDPPGHMPISISMHMAQCLGRALASNGSHMSARARIYF